MEVLLILTLAITPTYVWRFNFLHLPTNFLMLWVFFVWAVFALKTLYNGELNKFIDYLKKFDKKILAFILLFFIAGLLSLFYPHFDHKKLGQFLVLFLEPISIFFIGKYYFQKNPETKDLLLTTCYLLLGLAGAYAIVQYFSLKGLPVLYQGNPVEPKRAVSFFDHPNFYALWSAPLLALLIPDLIERSKNWKLEIGNWKFFTAWVLGIAGLLLSLSRAGWIGLAAAVILYGLIAADLRTRKTFFAGIIIIVICIASYAPLRSRILLPFYGEKSASSRVTLWQSGWQGIKQSPLLGLGLNGYSDHYRELIADPSLDMHNYPHNIFLDLWVETGLMGLISLTGLIGLYIYKGLKNKNNAFALSVALFLITLIFQGLIDNPYFKNDLAMVFWMVLSIGL